MRFLQIVILCSLSCAVFRLCAEADWNFNDGGKAWEGADHVRNGILTVSDHSEKSGIYAVTKDYIPVNPGQSYRFGVICRTENVTSRSQMYVRVFDKTGKILKAFFTAGYQGADWKMLEGHIPAEAMPKEAAKMKIILQPAAGAAEATGKAEFRGLFLHPEIFPVAQRKDVLDITKDAFFKTEQVYLSGSGLQQSPFSRKENQTRLEISWSGFQLPAFLAFAGSGETGGVKIHFWNDELQKFEFCRESAPAPEKEFFRLDLTGVPFTRKILLTFGNSAAVLSQIRFHVLALEKENWKASWIWFTAERVENVKCCLRKELILPSRPVRAIFQTAADDGAVLSVNGMKIGNAGSWKKPACRDIAPFLREGKNILGAAVWQARYGAGLLAELDLTFQDGDRWKIVTDGTWRCSRQCDPSWDKPDFPAADWIPAVELHRPPQGPWGEVPYQLNTPRRQLTLQYHKVPETPEAGKKYQLQFDLSSSGGLPSLTPVDLVIAGNGREFQRSRLGVWKPGDRKNSYRFQWEISPYLVAGNYQITLEIPQCEALINGQPFIRNVRIVNNRHPEPSSVQIRNRLGSPVLFINGRPTFHYMALLASGRHEYARAFHEAGFELMQIIATIRHSENGHYDFSGLDKAVLDALRGNPDAYLMVRILLQNAVTEEFRHRYPEELVRFDDGRVSSAPSLASTVWRNAVSRLLTAAVRHIQSSPYADRLIGILPGDGEEGQWMHRWSGSDPSRPGTLSDYSLPMLRYFRAWLEKKYKNDAGLQAAWGQSGVTLKTALIPSGAQRVGSDRVFRSLPQERPVVDYAEALSDVVADSILQQLKTIKDASSRRLLTCILYGHIIDLGNSFLAEQVGYLKMRRIIESPDLDYVAGPLHYGREFRDAGSPSSFDYPAPAVLRLHNKIWLQEDDLRTHLTNPPGYAMSVRTAAQTDQVLAREFAKGICSGAGMYFCDGGLGLLDRGWLDDTETVQTLRELKKIAADAAKKNLASRAEIAVVFSDVSIACLRPLRGRSATDGIMHQLIYNREAVSRIGAPFDEYLTDDFLNAEMPDYKLYIFMNAFYLTSEERAAIRARLKRTGAAALWFYAPGVFNEEGFDIALSGKLTGIPLQIMDRRIPATMRSAKDKRSFGLPPSVTFRPVFLPHSDDLQILATLNDGKTPALVKKGRHYFSAMPGLPPDVYRRIAEESGVFIYCAGDDAVYANASYWAVHTSGKRGERKIRFPHGVSVRRIWPNEESEFLREIRFYSQSPQTMIFEIKTKDSASK